MVKLRIALAQMVCEKGDWAGNLARAAAAMAQARAAGCDLIVLPEMGLSGYCDPARFSPSVQPLDSAWVQQFVALTVEYGLAASGGWIETNPADKPYITQVLAQAGRIVGVYRKVEVVDEEAAWFAPGSAMPVFTLALPGGAVRCALAICADSDRPDLFAAFARQGAQIVLHSSAPGLYGRCLDAAAWQRGYDWYRGYLWERLPGWARANHLWIAVATQTGATVDEDFPGGSYVFGPDGRCRAEVGDGSETLLVHDVVLAADAD